VVRVYLELKSNEFINILFLHNGILGRTTMRKRTWMLTFFIPFVLLSLCYMPEIPNVSADSSTSDWPMFRHDLNHTGYTAGAGTSDSFKSLWNFTAGAAVWSSPAVVDGYVFVGCRDGNILCLNASTGTGLWGYQIGSVVEYSSPAIANGYVYICSFDGYVNCVDVAYGMPIWRSEVGGALWSSPAVVGGRVYVGSSDHNVYCLNGSDGAKIWNSSTLDVVHSSPAVSDGVVYVGSTDNFVYALNASTGKEIWCSRTRTCITSSPSVYNGYVYIGSNDGCVYAFDASTGDQLWKYQTANSVTSSPAVAYGCVFVGSEDNNVYCLNASTGKKIWQSPTGYWVGSSPAVADGNVYVGSEDYCIYCLNASTGAKKWSYATENAVYSSPAIVNNVLYVGSCDFRVYALELCNSTVDPLPSTSNNPSAWTKLALDLAASAIGAVIVFEIAFSVYLSIRSRKNVEAKNAAGQNMRWFSKHADALCVMAILVFSTVFFVNLGSGPLWGADEQTYSQWAYHMIKTGDYLTPWAFGGSAIWIGKPPLVMWLMSLSYQVFGVNNFATRFWSPVFGTLSLIVVFYLGKELFNRHVGFISALVLGTFATFYSFATHAMTDMPLVFFSLASIYFLLLSEKNKNSNRYPALSGLFFGLAFMTKQVQALLIPVIAFAYLATTQRSFKFLFTKRFALFWGVALLTFAPWLIYMNNRFGAEFWQWFFVYGAISRTVGPLEGHVGSYLFYFNYLTSNENLLWIIILPFAAGLCVYNSVVKHLKQDLLLLEWMVVVLVILTFVQTKIHWYILPVLPAFAIAIGNLLYLFFKKIQARA
jgi:outer membrane protein assembly factor BamB